MILSLSIKLYCLMLCRLMMSLPLVFLLMVVGASGAEWSMNYIQQEICALNGSTVFMNGTFTHPEHLTVNKSFWVIDPVKGVDSPDLSTVSSFSGRVEYFIDEQNNFALKLSNIMKKDEHKYCFRVTTTLETDKWIGTPGIKLRVTGKLKQSFSMFSCFNKSLSCSDDSQMISELHVESPGEVTEGESAVLTCKTTCSLTDPTFIWYKDGRPLTTEMIQKNQQLHLQTVSSEDAGSYSCAVRGSEHLPSTAQTLRVRQNQIRSAVWITVGGGGGFLLLLLLLFILILIFISRMKKRDAGSDQDGSDQDDVQYATVTHSRSRPVETAGDASSGAPDHDDDVQYATVRTGRKPDVVIRSDQQEELQYASVTFHHRHADAAATG
uniref:Ig-like domain-containing protein n=1 Tax=Astyanax mexicanus TaxID=7994 RepID=A0A3B1JST7_ASTMX